MSEPKPFPFILEGVFFANTNVNALPGFNPNADNPKITPESNIAVKADTAQKNIYFVSLRMVYNATRSNDGPYFVDVECLARFLVIDEDMPEEERLRGLTITGHNVAYGAIRELVSTLTSRHVHGPLVLGLSLLQGAPPKTAEVDVPIKKEKTAPSKA